MATSTSSASRRPPTRSGRRLILPLLAALTCVGAGTAVLPAGAATRTPAPKSHPRIKKLHIDSIKVGTNAGPLLLRVAADVHTELRMTVDGRRVKTPFEPAGPKAQKIELRAEDGLRAGSNKLRIRGARAGVISRAARTVKVPDWALLADAGEDVGTPIHVRARTGTAPPPGSGPAGADVNYSWHILRHPRGAKAGLADPNAPRPVLQAEDPGLYVLQLEADPEGNDEPSSLDQVTVAVTPNDPPIGVFINTIGRNYAIEIGDRSYGAVPGELHYLVLERATRAVVDENVVQDDSRGLTKLSELADKYGSGNNYMRYTMIVTGPFGLYNRSDDQVAPFVNLLKKLGVALPSVEDFRSLKSGQPFSVIGIPGAPAGAATIRLPVAGYDPPTSAAITGYLQPNQAVDVDGTPVYEYVSAEQPSFETRAPGSGDKVNKMVIGGQTYTGTLTNDATAGFHVVVLESLTLRPLTNQAISTNGGGITKKRQEQAATGLKEAIEKPGGPLVFVQTIGKPAAEGPAWQGVVSALVRLGANAQVVNALDGTTEFALASRLGAKAPPAEASTAFAKGSSPAPSYPPASLVGTLARSRTSGFVPNLFGAPTARSPDGGINLELTKVAYQPGQAWPLLPGGFAAETAKAEHFLCEGMKFCLGPDSCPTVRECFWQRYSSNWGLELQLLERVKYPGGGKGFSERSFEAVKKELSTETADVANVVDYLKRLQEPFEKSDLSSYIDLQGISKNIYDSVQPPPADNSKAWTLGLISKIIAIGGAIPPPGRYAASGLSAIFGLASYLSTKSGQPILGSEITARASELANELVNRIAMARKSTLGLGMMIVSDYGKLTTADRHISTDWALPNDIQTTIDAYRVSAKQWFYEALIPTAFPYLIRVPGTDNARSLNCRSELHWPNQPDAFQMSATIGYEEGGKPINGIFFFAKGIGGAASPNASIGDEMFRPRGGSNPGLGIEKLGFFSPRLFGGRVFHAIQGTTACALGFLPNLK